MGQTVLIFRQQPLLSKPTCCAPGPYQDRTCSVHSPLKGTFKWRKYGEDTEQVWTGYGPDTFWAGLRGLLVLPTDT